jgi:Zn-dependent metalloprotease
MGLNYVPYERTYRGIPVVGGDFVVSTDDQGKILATSVAQTRQVKLRSVKATVARTAARTTSQHRLRHATLGKTRLVVLQTKHSRLAWETWVTGRKHGEASRLTVYVDARTGHVLTTKEHVLEGTGNGNWEGTVTIPTSGSGSSFSMTNSNATTLKCQNSSGNATFTGTDDVWGNGSATDRETGCVDAFYSAEKERQMLSTWLGRNGMNGSGGWVPIRVGLNDVNAYYDGTQVQIGHTQTGGKWIGSIDVVAHEFGHGVDDKTPGGISGGGTQEFVADTFGAATEWYANNPADAPDFTVGEEVNLVGQGPIRVMYNPSAVGDANCYSSSTPGSEVHSAAGPGNHWYYLVAEGTNPTDGQPTSPTCNGSSVTGIGRDAAAKIWYRALTVYMTSGTTYAGARTATLDAARDLYGAGSAQHTAVAAAWSAVSVG